MAAVNDQLHILHRDFETRSNARLDLCGAWRYAADPSSAILCVGYAVDDGPVQIWTPGQPVPAEFREAAIDPAWLVVAHNDQFESAIEERSIAAAVRLAVGSARAPSLHAWPWHCRQRCRARWKTPPRRLVSPIRKTAKVAASCCA